MLERLKSQEKARGYKPINIVRKVESVPIKTIQQQKVKDIIDSIDRMEKKMKADSHNYINLYWDLLKLEKRFLAAVEELEKSNIKSPELFSNEIERRRVKIQNKFAKVYDLHKDKLDDL